MRYFQILILIHVTTYCTCEDVTGSISTTPTPNDTNSLQNNGSCLENVSEGGIKCQISFREEGGWNYFTPKCLEKNTFSVPFNRSLPSRSSSADQILFRRLYPENPPPYARILCSADVAFDFEFDGVGSLEFFRIWKSIEYPSSGNNRTTVLYKVNAEVLLTPSSTGFFIFRSLTDPLVRTSIFIYSEQPSGPYLINVPGRVISRKIDPITGKIIIPCISTNPGVEVFLDRHTLTGWIRVNDSRITYKPKEGFVLDSIHILELSQSLYTVSGQDFVLCSEGDKDPGSILDPETLLVKVPRDDADLGVGTASSELKIEILTNGRAICSAQSSVGLRLTNIYTRNPTESKLIKKCVIQGRQNCGSHSYHERREGTLMDSTNCSANYSACTELNSIHKEGILICVQGNTSVIETTSLEYFTGLDGVFYTNVSSAPALSLLKPVWTPNNTQLSTGIEYSFKCMSVGLPFVKDPQILWAKFSNGAVEQISEFVWWQSGTKYYTSAQVVEIGCSDKIWNNNEFFNASVPVVVAEKNCSENQWTCRSGQCIRDLWRCDGDKDCTTDGGSDELLCDYHTCKPGHWKCLSGQCISEDKKCNNKKECPDGSEESYDVCKDKVCGKDEFKCGTGQCIAIHFLCDTDNDCYDESDESRENCAMYYPVIRDLSPNETSFTENSLAELICETADLPTKLKPRLEWWHNDKNLTDDNLLWRDITGRKLALRLPKITKDDAGQYTCYAQNSLQRVQKTFTVIVAGKDRLDCESHLSHHECLRRGCVFAINTCTSKELKNATESDTKFIDHNTEASPVSSGEDKDSKLGSTSNWLIWSLISLLVIVLLSLLAVVAWKYWMRRTIPIGSVRMSEEDEVVLHVR